MVGRKRLRGQGDFRQNGGIHMLQQKQPRDCQWIQNSRDRIAEIQNSREVNRPLDKINADVIDQRATELFSGQMRFSPNESFSG